MIMKNETDPMKISQVRSSLLKQKVNNSILKEPFSSIFVFMLIGYCQNLVCFERNRTCLTTSQIQNHKKTLPR
jgi:hypothetical protein